MHPIFYSRQKAFNLNGTESEWKEREKREKMASNRIDFLSHFFDQIESYYCLLGL